MLSAYRAPEVALRKTVYLNYGVPKLFIFHILYLRYTFRSSTVTGKQ